MEKLGLPKRGATNKFSMRRTVSRRRIFEELEVAVIVALSECPEVQTLIQIQRC